jgi:hypothetical protein
MEDLFVKMLTSLSKATASIEAEQVKVFSSERKSLSAEQWNEYGDCLRGLETRLMQLNNTFHFENVFEEGLPNDVINYAKFMNENKQSCEELVGYLLSRTDDWQKYDNLFLEEVLNGIIENSDRITELLTA